MREELTAEEAARIGRAIEDGLGLPEATVTLAGAGPAAQTLTALARRLVSLEETDLSPATVAQAIADIAAELRSCIAEVEGQADVEATPSRKDLI